MRITDIRQRRHALSAVYIDGEFAVSLDTQTLLEQGVNVGQELDDERLHSLIEQSNERRAKEKALWLLSYRSHSKKELRDKIRRTCDTDAADKAVERMEELGLIDDRDFAEAYARRLVLGKRLSKRAAMIELRRKGIDPEIAKEILDAIDADPQEQIRQVIERKYKNLGDEKTRRRAVAALRRLGYGWDDINTVLNESDD